MKLYVLGFGAGNRHGRHFTSGNSNPEKQFNYRLYCLCRDFKKIGFRKKNMLSTGMKQEKERVCLALEKAQNQNVSLVCSGDAEVYGMAGLTLELAENYPDTDVEIIPGVTSALSGGALLGAPLTHDFAIISLSDLLTPAEKIRKRLRCTAEADFVIVLHNPSSRKTS